MSDFDLERDDLEEPAAVPEDLDAEELVRRTLEIVSSAKAMPLSASVLVSRDEVVDLLTAALERLPDELRQARWLLKEREERLAESRREADALVEEVKAQAERMVSRTEIVRQANQVAQRILDQANEEARNLRHATEDYCDHRLAQLEIVIDRLAKTLKAGREKLQATSAPRPVEAEAPAEEGTGDGFFDQDRA